MTTGDWAFILIVLIMVLASLVCALAWKIAYADGHEAGRQYERSRQNIRRVRANRTRGMAATSLVASPAPWEPVVTVRRENRTEELLAMPTALTVPFIHPHAPAARVLLSDTGSFRASTERFIADMRADEDAYRERLRQEISA